LRHLLPPMKGRPPTGYVGAFPRDLLVAGLRQAARATPPLALRSDDCEQIPFACSLGPASRSRRPHSGLDAQLPAAVEVHRLLAPPRQPGDALHYSSLGMRWCVLQNRECDKVQVRRLLMPTRRMAAENFLDRHRPRRRRGPCAQCGFNICLLRRARHASSDCSRADHETPPRRPAPLGTWCISQRFFPRPVRSHDRRR
jgi:hypothetical protein